MTAPDYVLVVPLAAITKTTDVGDVLRARRDELIARRRTGGWSPHDETALNTLDHVLGDSVAGPPVANGPVTAPDAPILLRLREVAQLLGVSLSTVEDMAARGELPVVRIGKSVRVRRDELTAWLDALTERQRGGAR